MNNEFWNKIFIGSVVAFGIIICAMGFAVFLNQIKGYLKSREPVKYVCPHFIIASSYQRYLENRSASLVIDKVKKQVWLDGRLATEVTFGDIAITGTDAEVGPFKFDTITQNLTFKDRSINCRSSL